MSWNAIIILKNGQEVKGIEVGEFGSPGELGPYLLHFYNNLERVQALIDLGDIYVINKHIPGKEFIEKINKDVSVMRYDQDLKRWITTYIDYAFAGKEMIQVYTSWDMHKQTHIASLKEAITYKPESLYVYDVSKHQLYMDIVQGDGWLYGMGGGSKVQRFVPLEDFLKETDLYRNKKELLSNKKHMRGLLNFVRKEIRSKQTKINRNVTPRMIVMQANKEFIEGGIQAKLSYTTKDIGQTPGKAVFIRTSNGKPISKSCVPSELIKELRTKGLSRAYKIVKEYERQNSLTDSV